VIAALNAAAGALASSLAPTFIRLGVLAGAHPFIAFEVLAGASILVLLRAGRLV
jgi:hypothetical protein